MKRYMAYSFCTLWTLVLIVGLIAAVIHQAKFQASPTQSHLTAQINMLEQKNARLEENFKQLKLTLKTTQTEYDNYQRWVMSWR
jgi:uncharacterized protein YlxW (UPF0749 family)